MDDYTFENMQNLTLSKLNEIKEYLADELVKEKQKRLDAMAAILFYQEQIKLERENQ